MKRYVLALAFGLALPGVASAASKSRAMEDAAIDRLVMCVAVAARGIADQPDPASDLARAAIAMCPGEMLALSKLSRRLHGDVVGNHAVRLAEEECYKGALATIVSARAEAKHRPSQPARPIGRSF